MSDTTFSAPKVCLVTPHLIFLHHENLPRSRAVTKESISLRVAASYPLSWRTRSDAKQKCVVSGKRCEEPTGDAKAFGQLDLKQQTAEDTLCKCLYLAFDGTHGVYLPILAISACLQA
jgi:hypothetical protein